MQASRILLFNFNVILASVVRMTYCLCAVKFRKLFAQFSLSQVTCQQHLVHFVHIDMSMSSCYRFYTVPAEVNGVMIVMIQRVRQSGRTYVRRENSPGNKLLDLEATLFADYKIYARRRENLTHFLPNRQRP